MDDRVKKNKLEIHKEATEWSKKINIVYENLLNGSENNDRKIIEDAIRFYGPNFQRLPECVESSIKLMKCFLMSSGENNELWDLHQKNAFNVFVSAMISQKKEDFIIRKVLGCWSDFLTKLPEEQCQKLINSAKSSKIIKMLFHKLGQARTYFTQMRLVEILHIYSKYLPNVGFKLMEDVKLNGSPQLYDQLHALFLQINFDDFVDTCRRFLNFYNTYLGKKSGIVSMLGRLRIMNNQTFSKNDIHADFFDFNGKCLSMSFFISKKFFVNNLISTEWIYVEIEDFEIDAMEFDDFTDPTEKNIQLSIHPSKYFILDNAGKTVHNIPELEKLVIEINDESSKKKTFREKVYAYYKNRSKVRDDATTKGDDESMISFATYNTDFCNSSMIEQLKNRNLSVSASIHELEPASSLKQTRIANLFNSLPLKQNLTKSESEISLKSPKKPKQSEDLYSSIDYGRRNEHTAIQLEKVIQKVRPMQEKPPIRSSIQFEPYQAKSTSVPVVPNKKVVKLPQKTRTEALRQDVYDDMDDGGDSPVVSYQSFISQEREKKKLMLQKSNVIEVMFPDSEDFTLEDNIICNEDPPVAKKSSAKKVPVKKVTQTNVTKAVPKRSMQTRSKKEPAQKKMKISSAEENISLPKITLKSPAKTRKLPANRTKSPIVMKETKNHVKTRQVIFYSSSEDNFEPIKNRKDQDSVSDMDIDVVIQAKAPKKAIEPLIVAKNEMKKIQVAEKIRKNSYVPVVRQLKNHPVEVLKKATEQKPKTSRKNILNSSSEDNFEPIMNYQDHDYANKLDLDVITHPNAKKKQDEMKKIQEAEKIRMKSHVPVIKQLKNHPVEVLEKATEQKPKTSRKNILNSSSEDNFEPIMNYQGHDSAIDVDMDVIIHHKASKVAIESLLEAKKKREEMKKMQEADEIRKKSYVPIIKQLKDHPVEVVKKANDQKPKNSEYKTINEMSYEQRCPGDKMEKFDSVQVVRNVTFCTRVSPGTSKNIQDKQKCVSKAKKSNRMADVDEILQYNEMEGDNLQLQNNVQSRAIGEDIHDLTMDYNNDHFKRMKTVSKDNQNLVYDTPINYNFDQLKNNKLLNKFISQANNNENDQQQQRYQESVTVQRTTTIQKHVSIDQSPSNATQIVNRSNFNVAHRVIPSTLRENYKTRASLASAEARKKIMTMKKGIVKGIDESFKESLAEGIERIGNLNKDIKVHWLQHIQLMKKIYHSKKRLLEYKGKSRQLILDVSDKLEDALMQVKETAKHDKKIISEMGLELKQKEKECKTRAWQCFMDEFLNNVQEETIKHYEF